MQIVEALNAPWAVLPEVLVSIHDIFARHSQGEQPDISAIEAKLGRPLNSEPKGYQVVDGVGVLPIEGVIGKKMNLMTAISGGTSTQLAARDLSAALNDPSVHSIILAIDSPGGTADGTEPLANLVREARGKKPIVALADGTMASAAYWIGSAADAVYAADSITQVGSIGVVQKHIDISGAQAKDGIKTTEVTAGKFKRSVSSYAPLSEAGRREMQDDVDYVYSRFVAAVAQNRGVSEEKVLHNMADGRTFRGQQAVAAGLIDGISTLDALVAKLNAARSTRKSTSKASTGATMPQTKEQILAESPDAARELIAQGVEQERARIQGVENAMLPGHEKLIAGLKFDGKTSPGDAALAVLAAESEARGSAAQALADDAPQPVRTRATPDQSQEQKKGDKTKDEQAAEAAMLAAKEGISFPEAFKKLGFVYA